MPPAITYRTDGAWGAGKGSNLTAPEVDTNFYELVQAIAGVAALEPKEISAITIVGNVLRVTLEDASFYEVVVPTAQFNWTGPWQDGHDYLPFDLFTANDGLYMVQYAHSTDTGSEFNPDATNMAGLLAVLLIAYPTHYDIGFFVPGKPGRGLFAADVMFSFRADRPFYFNDFTECVGGLEHGSTTEMIFPIYKNDTHIGSFIIPADSESELASSDDLLGPQDGIFDFDGSIPVQFEIGDRLKVLVPNNLDAYARELTITFAATRGTPT